MPSHPAWTTRPATPTDAHSLALIGAATFLETFAHVHTAAEITEHCAEAHNAHAYKRHLAQPTTNIWLLETATTQAPIGYAMLTTPSLPGHQPEDLELRRIYTLSKFHGTGAGTALMHLAVSSATQRGATRLLLGVFHDNPRAIAFYQRHGFEQIGAYHFHVGPTAYTDLILARPLNHA